MDKREQTGLEAMLAAHYAAQRDGTGSRVPDALVTLMMEEDARARIAGRKSIGHAAFVAAQVRYIPAWVWLAQIVLVAFMFITVISEEAPETVKLTVGILSAVTVLVGMPTMHASKLHGVAELEYSCPNNAASAMMARCLALGCSSSLVVAIMIACTAASINTNAFVVALWACPPFFFSCAGSLAILRRANPQNAVLFCAMWTIACSVLLAGAGALIPNIYDHASLTVWGGAAAIALTWLVRELIMTLHSARAGLDSFSPFLPNTNE